MLLHRDALLLWEQSALPVSLMFGIILAHQRQAFPLLSSFPLQPPVWMQNVTYSVYMCAYIIYIFLASSKSVGRSFHKRKILWDWCCDT